MSEKIESHETHAVVIGGSIAGLAAARVLSDYFDHVTIIERDTLPEDTEYRNGAPQARHLHILLKRGEVIFESLFPGFTKELEAGGAVPINFGSQINWFAFGEWRPHYQSDLTTFSSSRPLLELTIRRRVGANPKISFIQQAQVIGLETDSTKTRATGVRITRREGSHEESIVTGDLIVDTSGRESRASDWLKSLGYVPPEVTTVNAFPGYSSRVYKSKADIPWKFMYMQPVAPMLSRGAAICEMEGGQWNVVMIGMGKDYPPTDEDGFLEFARSLPSQEAYNAIKDAEPLSPIIAYRKAENRLYHYDSLPRYLENFVLMGDSVYALNPVYGQGMSVAAMCAAELGNCLSAQGESLTGLAEKFQKKVAEIIMFPWQIATGEDFRWPTTEGIRPDFDPGQQLMQNYFGQVMLAANRNPYVLDIFYRVQNMIESPETFFRPDVVMQVVAEMSKMMASSEPKLAA